MTMVVTTSTFMDSRVRSTWGTPANRRPSWVQAEAAGAATANGFSSAVGPYTDGTD
jgi:hypothetical protein